MKTCAKGINLDTKVVEGFGDEWSRFDQSALPEPDAQAMFDSYFSIFPWDRLPKNPSGFDLGCGSGRWARLVAPRVGHLDCIDASAAALDVAKRNLRHQHNCDFHLASVDDIPLEDGRADFGFSLGVLHHVPDTQLALNACVRKLKPGAPFLVYLYYAFDNRPTWFRLLWKCTEIGRFLLSRAPNVIRHAASEVLALTVYWPLARLAWVIESLGGPVHWLPLSYYRRRSYYVMRTDALDRFGTRLERRFSRADISTMLQAGLSRLQFSNTAPYWCVVGFKK